MVRTVMSIETGTSNILDNQRFSAERLEFMIPEIFELARQAKSVDDLRQDLSILTHRIVSETFNDYDLTAEGSIIRVRDCARMLHRIFTRRSVSQAGFSVVKALRDIAIGMLRPDLTPGFYAEILHLFLGLQGRGPGRAPSDFHLVPRHLEGREAANERSRQLDDLFSAVEERLKKFPSGLNETSIKRRHRRRKHICSVLSATESQWYDWRWQLKHIVKKADLLEKLARLSPEEKEGAGLARRRRLPFGITPHYLSLMDDEPNSDRDRSIRAQVIPPLDYIEEMTKGGRAGRACHDFMKEADTSPQNLITRRYPAICIYKPFNTCPQICVYCQRNWEIEDAMEPGALASPDEMKAAVKWIEDHPMIHDVLITGGDPLAMTDEDIVRVLDSVASIPTIERIRIGTRTLITMPMRITDRLVRILAGYRVPGKRQVAVVTHAQHPYELTPDTAVAVEKLRSRGIPVYNQMVFTFYVSRRFEATYLRRLLARIGIEPYYTFNTKGKEETMAYRVPLARLLQEQKEEARLLPGLTRTDEAVYNVPGFGKNYLRARQHRDLISILPNGARVYEFHPWDKNIFQTALTYISEDVPILDYLKRLEAIGEDVSEYETIWYYF
jgi:lysine 2,3-aminomutase